LHRLALSGTSYLLSSTRTGTGARLKQKGLGDCAQRTFGPLRVPQKRTKLSPQGDLGTKSRRVRSIVAIALFLAAANANDVLRDAATAYKEDTETITVKVKQEFAAKEKATQNSQAATKTGKSGVGKHILREVGGWSGPIRPGLKTSRK
jgi:hypothetical protein